MKYTSMAGMVLALGLSGCTSPASSESADASEPALPSAVSAESASDVAMVTYTCACGKEKSVEASAAAPHC